MRFSNAQYLEKEVVTVSCRNNRASGAILDGQPVYLQDLNDATNFGVDSVLNQDTGWSGPLLGGVAKWSKLAGTSSQITGAQTGDVFEAVAYGFTDITLTRRTRLTSTDSWASIQTINYGDFLVGESIGSNFSWQRTVTDPVEGVVAAQSLASIQSNVSTFTPASPGTVTVDAYRMKAFVRLL